MTDISPETPVSQNVETPPLTETDVKDILNRLHELRSMKDVLVLHKNEVILLEQTKMETERRNMINALIPPEVQVEIQVAELKFDSTHNIIAIIAEIEAEFSSQTEGLEKGLTDLEAEARKAVVAFGKSVKGNYLHGVWNKGKTKVDVPGLKGFGKVHKEVLEFITEEDPTCTIRNV